MGSDKAREFSRVELQFAAQLILDQGAVIAGTVRDLSMTGVFIRTTGTAAVGQEGNLVLTFDPEGSQIEIAGRARVIRTDESGNGIAVQITEIELEGYEHLRNLITYNAPEPERVLAELEHHLGLKRRPPEPS